MWTVSLWPHTGFSNSKHCLFVSQGLSFIKLVTRNAKSQSGLMHSPSLFSFYCPHEVTSIKIPNQAVGQGGKCLRIGGELLETNTQTTTLLNSACEHMMCITQLVPWIFFYLVLNLLFELTVRIKAASIRTIQVNKIRPWELFSLTSILPYTRNI